MGRSIARTKKRKFSCNQHLKSSKFIQLDTSISDPSLSASSRKIVNIEISGSQKNNNLLNIYNEVASASMSSAANETKDIISKSSNVNDVSACQVSVDGTWQKRGHQSLNSIVTAISRENGKCFDSILLTKFCKACSYWNKKKVIKIGK